jgi:hypothetical protein
MDTFRDRCEALEQQLHTAHSRLRWWRGIAGGLGMVALVSLPLHSGSAAGTQPQGTAARLAALEQKLSAVTFDATTNTLTVTGANLQIVNGLGSTQTTNGVGNLIVGYNESRGAGFDLRTGSHTVVVGQEHNFSSYGGLVVGSANGVSGPFAAVSGGTLNAATGASAAVSGGVSGRALGEAAWVGGGFANRASGDSASVSGGAANQAFATYASVTGGRDNAATGTQSSVTGGFENNASGAFATVSGGGNNLASGAGAAISGGGNRTAAGPNSWAAGPAFAD